MKRLLSAAALFCALAGQVRAQYGYKMPVTVNHGQVTGTQSNFPVFVSVTSNNLKSSPTGHSQTNYDISPFSDTAFLSGMTHEREDWSGSTGQFEAWVLHSSINSSTDVTNYLGYGNAAITSSQENKTAVWSGYQAVWHFGSSSSLSLSDSTSNAMTLTNHGATAGAGKLNGAAVFNGSSWVSMSGIDFSSADFTVSFWIYPTTFASGQGVLGGAGGSFGLRIATNGKIYGTRTGVADYAQSSTALTLNSWNYVVYTQTGSTVSYYINGASAGGSTGGLTYIAATTDFGRFNGGAESFTGSLDEIRVIYGSVESSSKIATEWANQNNPSGAGGFITLGSEIPTTVPTAPFTSIKCTAQQCLLTYPQPADGSSCTLQASEVNDFSTLVPDVDPALFTNANVDTSHNGTVSDGILRTATIGLRTSHQALDLKLYSRSLQVVTRNYFTAACAGVKYVGDAMTANLPLGNTFPELPPFNSAGFGNYAWPTIDWSNPSKIYIDPMTGVAIKLATMPTFHGQRMDNNGFASVIDTASAWTNASPNAIDSTGASYAIYGGSATSSAPLLLFFNPYSLNHFQGTYGFFGQGTIDDLGLTVFGYATGDSTATDRTVSACISYYDSGTTCDTGIVDVVLPHGAAGAGVTVPSNYPTFPFAGWGGNPPKRGDFSAFGSTADVSGTAVTLTGGIWFNPSWKNGAKIFISGSSCTNQICTIASVQDELRLTLVENAGTLSSAAFQPLALAVKLWKKNGTGTVNISTKFSYAASPSIDYPINGAYPRCHPTTFTVTQDAAGGTLGTPVQGRLCIQKYYQQTQTALFLLIPSTGETRLLTPNVTASKSSDTGGDYMYGALGIPWGAFDSSDGRVFYGTTGCGVSSDKACIYRCTYDANGKAFSHPGYTPTTVEPGYDPAGFNLLWTDAPTTCNNVTKPSLGRELTAQFANHPKWDSRFYVAGATTVQFVANGRATIAAAGAGGSSVGLVGVVDLTPGANQGLVTAWGDSFSTWPARWGAIHAQELHNAQWFLWFLNGLSDPTVNEGGADAGKFAKGPWQATATQIYQSGSWTSNTALSGTYGDACPTSGVNPTYAALNYSSNNCVKFRAPQVCSHTPFTNEATVFPCPSNPAWSHLQDVQAGDLIRIYQGTVDGISKREAIRLLKVTDLGSGVWEYEGFRNAQQDGLDSVAMTYSSAFGGWYFQAETENVWADITAPGSTMTFLRDASQMSKDHGDMGPGPTTGTFTYVRGASMDAGGSAGVITPRAGTMPQMLGNQVPINSITLQPYWAGANRAKIAAQSYPSMRQYSATDPNDLHWALDFKHMSPSGGNGYDLLGLVAGSTAGLNFTQVGGTSTVWKFTGIAGTLNYKLNPVGAFGGYHLFRDTSGPSTVISDSTPWQYCVVLNAGECYAGSLVGEVYLSAPQSRRINADHDNNICWAGSYDATTPCVWSASRLHGNVIQFDTSRNNPYGTLWRALTQGLSGVGRQWQFASANPEPTAKWALMPSFLLDGIRSETLLVKLPPWPNPEDSGTIRQSWIPVSISIGPRSDITNAEIEFGYAENGAITSLYCTPYQSTCSTMASGVSPFRFSAEAASRHSVDSVNGVTITINAIPGRILYYRLKRYAGTTLVETGPIQAVAVN
jgi:hypothetical protein